MQNHNLFKIYTERLNKAGIKYVVTGSVAGIIYGEPRLTHDVDIILHISRVELSKLISLFPIEEFYIPPVEVIRAEIARELRGHFNIIHHDTGFKADIYLLGKDPLHIYAFKNTKKIIIDNNPVYIAPPEYVIIRKLEYFDEGKSEKHINDIKSIVENCSFEININFIMDQLKSLSSKEVFKNIIVS